MELPVLHPAGIFMQDGRSDGTLKVPLKSKILNCKYWTVQGFTSKWSEFNTRVGECQQRYAGGRFCQNCEKKN